MTTGEKIQALRKARGWSQEELAAQIGVSRQAVSRWESDSTKPEAEKILALCDRFGVSTDYLLREDAPAPRDRRPGQAARGLAGLGYGGLWRHHPVCAEASFQHPPNLCGAGPSCWGGRPCDHRVLRVLYRVFRLCPKPGAGLVCVAGSRGAGSWGREAAVELVEAPLKIFVLPGIARIAGICYTVVIYFQQKGDSNARHWYAVSHSL